MECFKFLKLERTKDIKLIKKAYAKLLQVYSPEHNPEGFQQLRKSYNLAIDYAKDNNEANELITEVDIFMNKFQEYYHDFTKRLNVGLWEDLLNEDICFNIETSTEVNERILLFMMEHFYFPDEIFTLFNKYFFWTSKKEALYKMFPKNYIDYIFVKCTTNSHFQYNYLLNCDAGKQDEFIMSYNKGTAAFEDYDLYNLIKSIQKAEKICATHPDLLKLKAKYFIVNGEMGKAEELLTHIINKNKNDQIAYHNRANLYIRIGRFDKAYNDLKVALNIDSEDLEILLSLGKCCISLKKYQEAILHLEKVISILQYNKDSMVIFYTAINFYLDELLLKRQKNPENMDLLVELAKTYFSIQKYEDCYHILVDLDQISNLDNKMYALFCRALMGLKKMEHALIKCNKALEIYPNDHEIMHIKALIYDEFGDYDESIKYYDNALEMNPNDALIYNNKAYILNKLEKYSEALKCCNLGITKNPKVAHLYKNKAEALLGQGLYEEALAACDEAQNIYFYMIDVFIIRMKIFVEIGRWEESLSIFSKAVDYGLKDSRLYSEKAKVLLNIKEYDEVINQCELALELDDKNEEAYYLMGLSYFNKEKYNEAINVLDKAININNKYEAALYKKMYCLLELDQKNEALNLVEKVILLDTKNIDRFYKIKADILYSLNKNNEALEACLMAVKKNSDNAESYYLAGAILNNLEKFNESIECLDKAVDKDPTLVVAYIDKSYALFKLQDYQKCYEQCDIALKYNPEYLVAHQNRAWSYFKLNNLDEAEKSCNHGLQINKDYTNLLTLKAMILKNKGMIKEAIALCGRILEIEPKNEDALILKKEMSKIGSRLKNKLFNKKG